MIAAVFDFKDWVCKLPCPSLLVLVGKYLFWEGVHWAQKWEGGRKSVETAFIFAWSFLKKFSFSEKSQNLNVWYMGAFKSQNLISVGKAGALNVTMFIVPKIALAHSHLQCTLKQFTLYQLPLLLVTLVLRSSMPSLHSAKGVRSRHLGGEQRRNQEFRFRFRQCRYRNFWQEKAREFVILWIDLRE